MFKAPLPAALARASPAGLAGGALGRAGLGSVGAERALLARRLASLARLVLACGNGVCTARRRRQERGMQLVASLQLARGREGGDSLATRWTVTAAATLPKGPPTVAALLAAEDAAHGAGGTVLAR